MLNNRKITLILAQSLNGVIGNEGDIPWHIPEDLRHFKKMTTGHHLVMGRKTYESIPVPFKDRTVHVMSNNKPKKGEYWYSTFGLPDHEIINKVPEDSKLFVCGGSEIYRHWLKYADEIMVTIVKKIKYGDVIFNVFEHINPFEWCIVKKRTLTSEAELIVLEKLSDDDLMRY